MHFARGGIVLAILGVSGASCPAIAQTTTQGFQSEARLDGIFARTGSVQAGVGVTIPAGIYLRTGLVAGIGAGNGGLEGRSDLVARFSLDPFRQSDWAPYAGAGLSGRYRSAEVGGSRAYLLVFLGIEGPLRNRASPGWVPALEVGLGGGGRVGVVLRRGIPGRR
jgi:hypothetical protein